VGGAKKAQAPKLPLYPKWGGAKPDKDDCPRCGQSWMDTRIFSRGSCMLCAIDEGSVDVPDDLKAKGWKLHRSSYHCISADQHEHRLGLPLYTTYQIEACIAQARGYQAAWEWLHDGGAGYAWGWRLESEFHIKYTAVHPSLGRIPRGRYNGIWLDALPEQIIVELVVEALQLAHHRRAAAAVLAVYTAKRCLADRARTNAAAFAAIPAGEFKQKGFV